MSNSQSPDLLWHYTDANGFLGILQSSSFWASSATYLNDDLELEYGKERLIEGLRSVGKALSAGNSHPQYTDGFALGAEADILSGHINEEFMERVPSIPDTYIVSFCENGDLLSQWRGYSEGLGFALGFDKKTLEQTATKYGTQARLQKIRYGKTTGENMFKPLILSQVHENWNNGLHNGRDPQLAPFESHNTERLLREVGWCKHPAFKEEQEWRLKIDLPKCVKVRSRGGDLLPYTPFDFPSIALRELRLGPGGVRDLRESAAKYALEAEGFKNIPISRSSAPYRP